MGRLSSRDRPEQLGLNPSWMDAIPMEEPRRIIPTEGPRRTDTIVGFVERLGLRMTASRVESNPYLISPGSWAADANHWRCTFSVGGARPGMPVRFQTYFSTNGGQPEAPNAFEVLGCLASDADILESHPSFEDWSHWISDVEGGGRQPRRAYDRMVESAARLQGFLGRDDYRTLINEVER